MRSHTLSLSLAAALVACSNYSDDCRNTLTCEPPYPPRPYCDGNWYYTTASSGGNVGVICRDTNDCSKDGVCCTEDGVCPLCPHFESTTGGKARWMYPNREEWDPGDTTLLVAEGMECLDARGNEAAGGSDTSNITGGAAGQSGMGGASASAGSAGVLPPPSGGSGGENGGTSGAGDSSEGGSSGAWGSGGAAGTQTDTGAGGNAGTWGASGSAGVAGESGSAGAAGVAGHAGTSGAAGVAGAPEASGAAGTAGAAGGSEEPDPCAAGPTGGPDEDECAIADAFGVFVASDGSDAAPGTEAAPVASLDAALSIAAQHGPAVIYVCAQRGSSALPYTAAPTFSGAHDTTIYGGFDCSNPHWTYDRGLKARFSLEPGETFRIDRASQLEFVDVAVDAAPAVEPGGSSVAMWITDSTNVHLERVELNAAQGVPGVTATLEGIAHPYSPISDLYGNDATADPLAAGLAKICQCEEGEESIGGAGGPPTPPSGAEGTDGSPREAGELTGVGSPEGVCAGGLLLTQHGRVGLDATPAAGALYLGSIDPSGWWVPQSGGSGADGGTGQGGGGGGSTSMYNAGGGGGCGGCGGVGAPGGGGGGASIALLAISSDVALTGCQLTAADGGDGGNGLLGQPGQVNPGEPDSAGLGGDGEGNACDGGNGGRGGNGGASGGGAGGLSVGVLWQDVRPTYGSDTSFQVGTPGLGGSAASPHDNAGVEGIAQSVLDASALPVR